MRKKLTQLYVCQECGSQQPKWIGKCPDCGAWNSLIIEKIEKSKSGAIKNTEFEIHNLNDDFSDFKRINTGNKEFDTVLGGGLVEGSAILLGGDPGIGKSTLLIQIVNALAEKGHECLYISGEESVNQIKLRAWRLKLNSENTKLVSITSLSEIKLAIERCKPKFLVIDSIQTIYNEEIESAPGSVSQVRSTAFDLIRIAKDKSICVILVGHVTKEGNIAGPKVLEHMVDTVLYFEGDRGYQYRIIRAVKNRFGAANEIGVFEMMGFGLQEVRNPSEIFLPNKSAENISGSCIFAGLEGTRPVLLEIQALVVPSYLPTPRRAAVGWDVNRLSMLIAVLNARLKINLLDKEVYLNVAGGLKVNEPAADLAVLMALISAAANLPIPKDCVFFGEVGLSGEVRMVAQTEQRLQEAEKLGFARAVLSDDNKNNSCNIKRVHVNHINKLRKILGE